MFSHKAFIRILVYTATDNLIKVFGGQLIYIQSQNSKRGNQIVQKLLRSTKLNIVIYGEQQKKKTFLKPERKTALFQNIWEQLLFYTKFSRIESPIKHLTTCLDKNIPLNKKTTQCGNLENCFDMQKPTFFHHKP